MNKEQSKTKNNSKPKKKIHDVKHYNSYDEWSKACRFMSDEEKEFFRKVVGDNAEYTIF